MMKQLLVISTLLSSTMALGQVGNYPIGSTVDNFTVMDVNGQTHDLYAYNAQGKYVLLEFFFYNNIICQNDAPAFSEFYETYGCNTADVICLAVNWGTDTDAQIAAFHPDFGGNHPHPPAVGSVGSAAVDAAFGVQDPTFCLIGPDHVMIDNDIWPLTNGMQTLAAAFPIGSIQVASCSVGLQENTTTANVEVGPVPTSDAVNLEITGGVNEVVTVTMLNMLGQPVMSRNLGTLSGNVRRTLHLGHLPDGQYTLQIRTGDALPIARRIVLAR